ncbi:sigma-70 family RNA polymerase sigma factor [Streptomyces sp. DSM 44915]|uniref:Sigma-70 family RNA polymerase sigma factor n=1 Tax=Streptomyces chisholmiae TaxID=3075540 RepID=A0ABU2JSV9_9ACTN|nr:sigma-70 family RNA polymerase sigma factor [Streptomyces sp. DSM 44915]MDT0268076.1 sigma-70 family RNA polymerase sigma factor [Streptomyces sp. DSM 44915]
MTTFPDTTETAAGPATAPAPAARPTERELERYRRELTGYCYRMLGSAFEAEDAVQDTMVRAWRSLDRFEGRSSLRSWLYRIATNVCLTMLSGAGRRARPMDLTEAQPTATATLGAPLPETAWIEPMPDARAMPSPDEHAETRESIRLAFIAALQHLAPRQRAVLILREVLSWRASEVAELLDTTVASVNSALQRARATLANTGLSETDPSEPLSDAHKALLTRYLDAFERYDMDALTALLAEDATLSMPPFDLWMRGPSDIADWMTGIGSECEGSRLVPTQANGCGAFGQYRADPAGGHLPWALQVIEISDGRITGINAFLDTARLFPLFGLPDHLPETQPTQETD